MSDDKEPAYRPLGKARSDAAPVGAPLAPTRLALVTGGHRRLGGIIAAALAKAGHSPPSMAAMIRGSIPIWR